MSTERFCLECACSGEPESLGKGEVHQEENWDCPLLGGKICETCCQVELAGGMGAPDTLEGFVRKTGKSAAEIHATCVTCPQGGTSLEEPPTLIMARGDKGEELTSGPEFLAKDLEFKRKWMFRLKRLKRAQS